MALAKIELKLGKKTITLTPAQFEELKQDMRDLDRTYNYHWYSNPWPQRWWGGISNHTGNQIYCNTAGTGTTTTAGNQSTLLTATGTATASDKVTYSGNMLKIT